VVLPRLWAYCDSPDCDLSVVGARVRNETDETWTVCLMVRDPETGEWSRSGCDAVEPGADRVVELAHQWVPGAEPETVPVEAVDEVPLTGQVDFDPPGCVVVLADGDIRVYAGGVEVSEVGPAFVACGPFSVEPAEGSVTLTVYRLAREPPLRRFDARLAATRIGMDRYVALWEGTVEDVKPFTLAKPGEAELLECPGRVEGQPGETVEATFVAAEAGTLTVLDHTGAAVAVADVEPGAVRLALRLPAEPGTYTWRAVLEAEAGRDECTFTVAVAAPGGGGGAAPAEELIYVVMPKPEHLGAANSVRAGCIA